MLSRLPDQFAVLIASGAAGAYTRALVAPQSSWSRRLGEAVAGALGAVFLGGFVGHLISEMTGAGMWAYAAAGFSLGEGGIASLRALRRKILKEDADDPSRK